MVKAVKSQEEENLVDCFVRGNPMEDTGIVRRLALRLAADNSRQRNWPSKYMW